MLPRFPGDPPRDLSRPLEELRLRIDARQSGARLDQALCFFLHWRSRTSVQKLIADGFVTVLGKPARAGIRVAAGDEVRVRIPPRATPDPVGPPEDLPIPILYEDRWMVALDKPAGLAVHPAGRRVHGTLIHFLHQRYRRPGDPAHDVVPRLLHRIDRETSGVVAASLDEDHHARVGHLFEARAVRKTYLAVVHGCPDPAEGLVDFGIGPAADSPIRLKLEARRDGSGLPALTRYRVLRRSDPFALVELEPRTGRTHQLRVHMAAIGCPLVGDKIYGVDERFFLEHLAGELSAESRTRLVLERQALHAHRLRFLHPGLGRELELEAPLPADMAALIDR
ncbi:MAG: RluA family pseudouridine synthase [Planctomycetes bacterium]|nr:RluA family pseudouridine synthase [Planctomycetota bacterium]